MKIFFEPQQSVASILNAFLQSDDSRVDLVFPSSTTFFDDPANLELLMTQSKLSGKTFCVVTENGELARKLSAMGIEVEHARALTKRDKGKETEPPILADVRKEASKEPSFETMHKELKESSADEFTKRYFDLEAPKSERNPSPLDAQKEKSAEQTLIDATIRPQISIQEPFQSKNVGEKPPLFEEEDVKSIFNSEEIDSFIKKPAKGTDYSDQKGDLAVDLALSKHRSRRLVWLGIGVSLIALAGIAWAVLVLPKADVSVFAQREKVAFSVDVLGAENISDIDLENRAIPLQRLQAEKDLSTSFEAKTKGNIEKKAHGAITVFNELSYPQVMIPSRFQALTGQIYWSQRNIKVPAAQRVGGKLEPGAISIEILADKSGSEFNLECSQANPCKFSIPAWKGTENFDKLYATASLSIKGGVKGQGFVVGQEEYKKAELELREGLLREAQKELSAQIPSGFTLLENTISSQLGDVNASHGPEELTSDGKVTLQGKITIRAFLIKTSDVKMLIDKITKTQLSKEKITRPESVTFEYSVQQFDFEKNQVFVKFQAQEELQFNIDPESIKKQLLGRSESEVQKILSDMPHVQSAEVVLWPFWVRRIPSKSSRVTVEVE